MRVRALIGVVTALACVVTSVVGASARAEVVCPNEALRQELRYPQLPECRAYEMVSPPFKDGSNVGGGVGAISSDGTRVIAQALGAFASVESEPFRNTEYEFSRTQAGWVAHALAPPASRSPESEFLTASWDLTKTLWGMHQPSQSIYEEDLYVREPDGRFVKVGPLVPPARAAGPPSGTTTTFGLANFKHAGFVGASADLSHVLVSIVGFSHSEEALWPGDKTVGKNGLDSLYEYVGGNLARPELVGVDNQGKQIGSCGTQLGSAEEEGDKYNAMSSDGERVFFTAKAGEVPGEAASECRLEEEGKVVASGVGPRVNELYGRINRLETVAISEPSHGQCVECRIELGERQAAEFRGASEDGSKVFFTTTQELLAGQRTENLYEYDFSNAREHKIVLVSRGTTEPEVLGVARISENGSHAYFVAKAKLTAEPRGGCFVELSSTERAEEESTQEGKCRPKKEADNLYVFERDGTHPNGHVAFIATLSEDDSADWGAVDKRPVQATPDGRFLVFTSGRDLTGDDTSTVPQVFEYDAQEEELVRASAGQKTPGGYECPTTKRMEEGYNCNGNTMEDAASLVEPSYEARDAPTAAESTLTVSNDGAHVFFESADSLTPQSVEAAAFGARSVYEYQSPGSVSSGNVYLISDGKDVTREGTRLYGTDATGGDVFFQSGDPLVASDTNTGRDIYDARVNGGFAEPAVLAGCEGEACQGSPSAFTSFASPGSSISPGGGNLAPPAESQPTAVESKPASKLKTLTRTQKLAKALTACRSKHKRKRASCEAQARSRYDSKSKKANVNTVKRETKGN